MIENHRYLPGQHEFGGSHGRVSENFPPQLTPPVLGGGLVHVLFWSPLPQEVLQELQEDQLPMIPNSNEYHLSQDKI